MCDYIYKLQLSLQISTRNLVDVLQVVLTMLF